MLWFEGNLYEEGVFYIYPVSRSVSHGVFFGLGTIDRDIVFISD